MTTMTMMHRLLFLTALIQHNGHVRAYYVSYEHPQEYRVGDRVQIKADKLTSPETLGAVDYPHLASCSSSRSSSRSSSSRSSNTTTTTTTKALKPSSLWKRSMQALHGDSFWLDTSFSLHFGRDEYCRPRCFWNAENTDASGGSSSSSNAAKAFRSKPAIDSYEYHYWLDNLPMAFRMEDDESVTTNFWMGTPIGTRVGSSPGGTTNNARYANLPIDNTMILYNHYNIHIEYYKAGENRHRILRTILEPFSIATTSSNGHVNLAVTSCLQSTTNNTNGSPRVHTDYDMLQNVAPQLLTLDDDNDDASSSSSTLPPVLFTYDVIWKEVKGAGERDYKNRWNVFLTMDGAQSFVVKLVGIFVSIVVFVLLAATMWTWVNRDLSYKPVMLQLGSEYDEEGMDEELPESALEELRMWPLSTRLFFPPRNAPALLCVACGTGAQILVTGFVFVILFRLGVVSQSLWANILTPAAVLYSTSSLVGGYVTGRMKGGLFYGSYKETLVTSLATALAYPFLGIFVVLFVYDILPPADAPNADSTSTYLPMILMWILAVVPLTLVGAYVGHQSGPMQDFPMSKGSVGYHDLDLQRNTQSNRTAAQEVAQEEEHRRLKNACYIVFLLAIGGILPVLGVFVSYSYAVAGPVFVGYYVDNSSYMITSYTLFVACTGAISVLLYYKQIRVHKYDWWWPAFSTGGSSGMYLFLLTISWLMFNSSPEHLTGRIFMLYFIWFAYTSLGVVCATGFCGVASCIAFTRILYVRTKQRGQEI